MTADEDDTGADEVPQPIPPDEALTEAREIILAALNRAEAMWDVTHSGGDEDAVVWHRISVELTEALTILRMLEGARG